VSLGVEKALWWGTYPPAGLGTTAGQGEGLVRQQGADAVVALALDAPSFVVAHPHLPVIYTTSETADGRFNAVDVSGTPRLMATLATGGADPCHILVAPDARAAYVCNYGSGDVTVVPLAEDGSPGEPTQVLGHHGSGPRTDRQESSHAHFSAVAPGGAHLLVVDLGTDELRRYRIGDGGLLEHDGIAASFAPGAGPRHLLVRGELIYVVCELNDQLVTLRWDQATGSALEIAATPLTRAPNRTGDELQGAHIALVEGEQRDTLLVSVRGADVISLHDLSPEGEARYRASLDVGHWPRHFAVIGDRLHVGLERGHEVRTYALADVMALPPEQGVGAVGALAYDTVHVMSPASVTATQPKTHA
jgi:6-phosphogluconolactonase